MGEFNTNLAAVCCFVSLDDVFKFPNSLLGENATFMADFNVKFALQVLLGEAILSVVQLLQKICVRESELGCVRLSVFINFFEF